MPQELDIAVGLDENTLIEVALSFNEPKSPQELGDTLGYKHVTWLWRDQPSKNTLKNIEEKAEGDHNKVKYGEKAKGARVSEDFPYDQHGDQKHRYSGAVVSGTPQELQRFMDMDIVRASVIGATIDKY